MELEAGKVFPGSLWGSSPALGAALALTSLLRWDITPFVGITVSTGVATVCLGLGTGFCLAGAPTLLCTYSACLAKLEVFLQFPQSAFVLGKPPSSLFSPWQHLAGVISRIEPFLPGVLSTQVRTSAPLSAPELLLAAYWIPLPLPPVLALAGGEHPQRRESFASCFFLDLPLLPSQCAPGERLCSGLELMPGSCQEPQTGR